MSTPDALTQAFSTLSVTHSQPKPNPKPETFVYFVPASLHHHVDPIHQENPQRLDLIGKDLCDFAGKHEDVRLTNATSPATIADLLLVHEYEYIRHVREQVQSGHDSLDQDTRLSPGSWNAACSAAGAVIEAVDDVLSGRAKRAFVAARPPGHHAGPRGAVPCGDHFHWRPDMCSSGFCLVNNVAIGAAHALRTYGSREGRELCCGGSNNASKVQKVAIVDFDIHDGNGTADIVRNLVPNKRKMPLPASWAPVEYLSYKPWRDENDPRNVFFGSIHLFDEDGSFYPGSGSHAESSSSGEGPIIVNVPLPRVLSLAQKQQDCLRSQQGLPPLKRSILARKAGSKAFRQRVSETLLPRLNAFQPDLILFSAGFDGHYLDGYHVLDEQDFAWLTTEVKKIAEECCNGRIVSVLEGGYHLERPAVQIRKKTRRKSKETAATDGDVDEEGYGKTGALVSSCRAHLEALVRDPSNVQPSSPQTPMETVSSYSVTQELTSRSLESSKTNVAVKVVTASTTLYEHLANENVTTHVNTKP